MCSGVIDWCAFDWQSFATLVTGALAVGAAVCVGRKQTEIQKRQTAIQEQSLKSDLFEKRFEVYKRVRNLLEHARIQILPSPEKLHSEYFQAMLESKFLFEIRVYEKISHLRMNEIPNFDLTAMRLADAIKHNERSEEINCRNELILIHQKFADELANLNFVFHEMNITSQPDEIKSIFRSVVIPYPSGEGQ